MSLCLCGNFSGLSGLGWYFIYSADSQISLSILGNDAYKKAIAKWFERKSVSSRSDVPSSKIDFRQKSQFGLLKTPLPLLSDPEGGYLPASLPFTVDAHVHLFPDHLFSAVWQWFEQFGWPIRYRLTSPEIINFLLARGMGLAQFRHVSI